MMNRPSTQLENLFYIEATAMVRVSERAVICDQYTLIS